MLTRIEFGLDMTSLPSVGRVTTDGVSVNLFIFALKSLAAAEIDGAIQLSAVANVIDRSTGEPIEIHLQRLVHPTSWFDRVLRANVIRSLLREMMMHELDENISIKGVRLFDPHKKERGL